MQDVFNDCIDEGENVLSAFLTQFWETTFTAEMLCNTNLEEIFTVAPDEGKISLSALADTYWEEMKYRKLLPSAAYD